MIFQKTLPMVLSEQKTQTRRIAKPPNKHTRIGQEYKGETFLQSHMWGDMEKPFPGEGVYIIRGREGGWLNGAVCVDPEWYFTAKWIVGRTYSVQPGRGQKQIARIRITGIRREDVREISVEDVIAEGFDNWHEFMLTWCEMHDPHVMKHIANVGGSWRLDEFVANRPDNLYQAWVIEFELIRDSVLEPNI